MTSLRLQSVDFGNGKVTMPGRTPRENRRSDQQTPNTPDRYRNDKAKRKEPDQPDHTGGRDERDPEKDYPDQDVTSPGH
jgi:hypothetical protein